VNGTFQRTVKATRGQKFRIVSPAVDEASPLLRLS
jgi:hypothetical protein